MKTYLIHEDEVDILNKNLLNEEISIFPDGKVFEIQSSEQLILKAWLVWNDSNESTCFFAVISGENPDLDISDIQGHQEEAVPTRQSTLWGDLKSGWNKATNTAENRTVIDEKLREKGLINNKIELSIKDSSIQSKLVMGQEYIFEVQPRMSWSILQGISARKLEVMQLLDQSSLTQNESNLSDLIAKYKR